MIKIADIIEEALVGGPQIRMVSFAEKLIDKADIVLVIPKKNSKELIKKCTSLNVKYKALHINKLSKNIFNIIIYFLSFIYEVFFLAKYISKERFDLIHVSGGVWQVKGIIVAKILRIPVVWHINDTFMPKIIRLLFKWFSSLPDAYVFASSKSKDYYGRYINANIPSYIIPATVDTSKFDPHTKIENKEKLKISKKKLTVGTVANISPVKGIDKIIEVANYFKDNDDIEFIIIGQVPKTQSKYFNRLSKRIKTYNLKNIHFKNFKEDIRPFLRIIDIYLCTSYAESSPISIWEAMSMEKAIISNNVGDVPKYIQNNHNGILINKNETNEIINGLKFLIKNKEKRKSYGIKARETCKKNLETRIFADHQLQVFEKLVINKR